MFLGLVVVRERTKKVDTLRGGSYSIALIPKRLEAPDVLGSYLAIGRVWPEGRTRSTLRRLYLRLVFNLT